MRRKQYVYRLDVTYPEAASDPEWYPEGYTPEQGYESDTGATYDRPFRWPRERCYFSDSAAQERAKRFREFGAHAVVVRSREIEWPAPHVANEIWTAAFELRAASEAPAVQAISDALVKLAQKVGA